MINSYSFGNITIDNNTFTKDLIIYPDHINSNWRRKAGHLLAEDDILEIILEHKDTNHSRLTSKLNNLTENLKTKPNKINRKFIENLFK